MRAILIDRFGFKKEIQVQQGRRMVATIRPQKIGMYDDEVIDSYLDPSKEIRKDIAEFYYERTFENEDFVPIAVYREK